MKISLRLALVLLWSLAVGCASKSKVSRTLTHPDRLAREIFETDIAFARMSSEQGPAAAFAAFTITRSAHLPPSGPPIIGNQAISQFMAGAPNSTLQWRPEHAEAAMSGDVGWSWGSYESRTPDPSGGRAQITRGRYVSIWRRQVGGAWRVILDIGNVAP
jgi:ketosteroid isomerase-like protein